MDTPQVNFQTVAIPHPGFRPTCLEIHSLGGMIKEVRWNGLPVPGLVAPVGDLSLLAYPAPFRQTSVGLIGVTNAYGATTFENARLMVFATP